MATKKWPEIPEDAIRWVRSVFAEANRKATERLINVPNIRETSLDDGLIEAITRFQPLGSYHQEQSSNCRFIISGGCAGSGSGRRPTSRS